MVEHDLVAELDEVRFSVRSELQTPLPLVLLGTVTFFGSSFDGTPFGPAFLYWFAALTTVFTLLAGYYRVRESRLGTGNQARVWAIAAVLAVVLAGQVASLIIVSDSPILLIGAFLLATGIALRDRFLGWSGGIVLILGVLETGRFVSLALENLVGDGRLGMHGRQVVIATMGLAMFTAGLVELRRRRR